MAPEISVCSTIAGLIAKLVEKEKGMEGIFKLINAGRKDQLNTFLNATDEFLDINTKNFNRKILQLIADY